MEDDFDQDEFFEDEDEATDGPIFTQLKAKCLVCSLHFIVCTEYPEQHNRDTLSCPECH